MDGGSAQPSIVDLLVIRRTLRQLRLRRVLRRVVRQRRAVLLALALVVVTAIASLSVPLDFVALLAACVVVTFLAGAALEPAVTVRPFELLPEYGNYGWTGEIAARHFADALASVARAAEMGDRQFPLRTGAQLPDVEIPRTGIKAVTLVDVFRFLLGRPRREVTAEVLASGPSHRLFCRIEGAAGVDVGVAEPIQLGAALRKAAEGLTRAVSPAHFLVSCLPDAARALAEAQEIVGSFQSPASDRAFAAKFACWLTMMQVAEIDTDKLPSLVEKATGFAEKAVRFDPRDGEAAFWLEAMQSLPRAEPGPGTSGRDYHLTTRWGEKLIQLLYEDSSLNRGFIDVRDILVRRLRFMRSLSEVRAEVGQARRRLLQGLRSEEGDSAQVHRTLLASALRDAASKVGGASIYLGYFRPEATPPVFSADTTAMMQAVRLIERTAASILRLSKLPRLRAALREFGEGSMIERALAETEQNIATLRSRLNERA